MVDRKRQSKITRRPSQPKPEEVEALLGELGTDPEASTQVNTSTREQVRADSREQVATEPEPGKDEGKAYPHRISFDMATPQYKRLKYAAFDSDRTMNEILREAVEDWMKTRDY